MEAQEIKRKPGIMLYLNKYQAIKDMSTESKGRLLDAFYLYNISGDIPELSVEEMTAFRFFKSDFDNSDRSYFETCEKRRIAANIRWHGNDTNAYKCMQDMQVHANDANHANKNQNKNHNQKKNTKEKSFVSLIPDSLKTDSFIEAWTAWEKHLKEKRKPLTESAARLQINKLSALDARSAIATIEKSISNNWQGIFPEEAKEELSISEKLKRGIMPN